MERQLEIGKMLNILAPTKGQLGLQHPVVSAQR